MKNPATFLKAAFAASCVIFIFILLFRNYADSDSLSIRIKRYERKADSLRQAVKTIDESVHQKDSILLVYLASLDKTLEELNKEAAKNKRSIEINRLKQDSVRRAYCREMARLEQRPAQCD